MKNGIALSGGGAKGGFHLGIIQELNNNGICFDYYSGTSAGSIVAALKGIGRSNEECLVAMNKINKKILDISFLNTVKGIFSKFEKVDSLFVGRRLELLLFELFGNVKMKELIKPTYLVSTSLENGKKVIFTNQNNLTENKNTILVKDEELYIRDVVYASCTLPGIFPVKELKGMKLIDGSLSNNVPLDLFNNTKVEKIFAVQLNSDKKKTDFNGIFDILDQSLNILIKQNQNDSYDKVEKDYFILEPYLEKVTALSFDKIDDCYEEGRKYVNKNMNNISIFMKDF